VERTEATADAPKVTTTAKKTAVNTKKVEKPTKEDVVVVKPTATTKRKTRADDVDEQALRGTQAGIAKTSNGRAKKGISKSEMVEDDAATKTEGPKQRTAKEVTVSAPDDMPAEPQKSRGRPKKTITDAASTKVEAKADVEKDAAAKRTTRARVVSTRGYHYYNGKASGC
jgi:hypothetical protein